jgi:hypothetical protein
VKIGDNGFFEYSEVNAGVRKGDRLLAVILM